MIYRDQEMAMVITSDDDIISVTMLTTNGRYAIGFKTRDPDAKIEVFVELNERSVSGLINQLMEINNAIKTGTKVGTNKKIDNSS